MLPLVAAALAGPIFLSMSDPVELPVSGSWVRVFAAEGGWHVTHGVDGNFYYAWLADTLTLDIGTARALTTRTNLLDHAITLCPDGTYLHIASATVAQADDTIYSFRYNDDFLPMVEGIVEEANPNGVDMDPAVVCGSWVHAAGTGERTPIVAMKLTFLDDTLAVTGSSALEGAPEAAGGSMDADENYLWAVGSADVRQEVMHVAQYAPDLSLVQQWDVDVATEGSHAYWFQRMEKVRDTFIVAHMMRTDDEPWSTQNGNIYLSAFDANWTLIDQLQVTDIEPPAGGFYAWFDRKDDSLLVSYHSLSPYAHNEVRTVMIDLEACEAQATTCEKEPEESAETHEAAETGDATVPGDEVSVDSGAPGATGGAGTRSDADGCGGESGGATAGALVVAVGVGGRRRRAGGESGRCAQPRFLH